MVVMFYGLMSWIFWRKGEEMLYRLVTILMIVSLAQCVKDLLFIVNEAYWQPGMWRIMTAVDMIIIKLNFNNTLFLQSGFHSIRFCQSFLSPHTPLPHN